MLEQKVIRLVSSFVSKNFDNKQVSWEKALKKAGLEVIFRAISPERDGFLADTKIILNKRIQSPERTAFTAFHELTHYLIKNSPLFDQLHDAYFRTSRDEFDRALERLCYLGAAEFLMPGENIREAISEEDLSVNLLLKLAQESGISKPALVIHMGFHSPVPCFIIRCAYGLLPTVQQQKETLSISVDSKLNHQLYIEYCGSPNSVKYFLARYTSIPHDHVLWKCYTAKEVAEEQSYVPFRSGKQMPCFCSACYHKGYVYAILYFEPRKHPGQQRFNL